MRRRESTEVLWEIKNEIPGFNVKLDWDRYYPYGNTFKAILGNVSSLLYLPELGLYTTIHFFIISPHL